MRKIKLFLSMLMLIAFSVGNVWGTVVSGTTYNLKGNSLPADWSGTDTWSATSATSYFLLTAAANYVQTDEFCQGGFTSIKVKARKYGGPASGQEVVTVSWVEKGGSAKALGTITPTNTTLTDYTISSPASVTGNKEGYIKITASSTAASGKGAGISEVTITYTAGSCTAAEPHTVSFSTGDGNPAVSPITEPSGGAGITLPAGPTPACSAAGWEFAGWAAAAVASETTTAPTLLSGTYHPAEDCTLYAVYKKTEAGGGSTTKSMNSFGAISGNVENDENVSYAATQGTSGTAPAVNTEQIRIYQNGGLLTITANNGVKLNSITIGSGMVTKVTYAVDGGAASGDNDIAKNGTFPLDELDATEVVFTCTGTDKNSRLYLNYLSVTYSGGGTVYYLSAPSCTPPTVATPTFTVEGGAYLGTQSVEIECATAGASIFYTLDGNDPSSASTPYEGAISISENKTLKAIAIKDENSSDIATAIYTIVSVEHAGTAEDPYSVADARTVIDAGVGITGVYAKGIVSEIVTAFNPTYGNISYNISADGSTTSDQLEAFRGFDKDGAWFTSADDVQVGDEVVIFGNLTKYESTYEFDQNNQRYSFKRKASAGIAWDPTSVTITAGDAWSAPTFANPNNLDVEFSSDDETVAIVSNIGIVSLEGGYGTAVITAHTDGDATHNAGNATYTITVNDPGSVDTRHIANSPATFTTTNGNLDPADIAYASYQGGSSTAPAIYNDGIRLYQIGGSNDFGGFVTITAKTGCTIDEVQITTTSKYATTVAYSKDGNENLLKSESVAKSGSYTTGTGLNVSSVNILNLGTGSDGRLEIASIKVYYTGEAATIDHYELGGTYQTAFMQDDEFNHTGLIVYAAYDALGENKVDITSMCTFSEPDMSTTGEKTIEITYNEAVVISYTINVAADSRKVAESPATFTTVSGDMTPNDITFASDQGGASTAPANYNDGIRLYQAPSADAIGGYITLKAKKGCTIDQVKITTTNSYATTVAYSVDGNENLLGSESVAKSSDYSTPSGLNVESVNIVNKGTGSSGRLEIASIKVWYTGDALSVDHYILGGTYETVFEQYGTFSYEGLTVTASYDAGETITEAVTGFTVEANLNTAGTVKANVMLNSVKIAEYDITVTASAKTDPELAYSPASVILTLGDALSAPTFSNTYNVSPITYSSDKPAVATVDAEGNIALAGGCGVAVITASFAENDDYIASEATFTITVNEPAEDLSGTWVVASSIAAGDRIIVGATVGEVTKTMGGQNTNNRAAVTSTLADGVLTPAEGTKTFLVVDAGDGKFALQALNGKYLTSATSGTGNNLLEAANYENDNAKWTITIDGEGVASVVAAAGSRTYMKYNNGSTLFSCYQYETSQSPINIYKKGTPDYGSYQRDVTNGNYGTICLPKAGAISGAKLFEVAYRGDNVIYCDEILTGEMEAGHPYIFQATSEQLNVVYSSSAIVAAGEANGLHGFYNLENMATDDADKLDLDEDQGNYILYQNQYWLVSGRAAYINNFRAYIKLGEISTSEPTPTPGAAPRRRVAMTVNGAQTATGMDELNASETPVKVMIDGQLFILCGDKMFDATGRLVK